MATKSRLLFLLRYLYENTDDDHPMSGAALRSAMTEAGFQAPDARTFRNDIETLIEAGFDIVEEVRPGVRTLYHYGARDWEISELRILIDAVSSSQFITERKSNELIRKLANLGGQISEPYLQPGVFVSSKIKTKSNQLLYVVQQIEEGIRLRKKISFRYRQYNVQKERVSKHDGEIYTVSPYATVWNADRYYLACWSDKHEKIITFRIDRMDVPTVTDEPAVPAPKSFRPKDYSEEIFRMYAGEDERVTLRCNIDMMDHVIDHFGDKIETVNVTESTFDTTVPVSVSTTFYAWVFQYAGKIRIIGPEPVREGYQEMLKEALDEIGAGNRDVEV